MGTIPAHENEFPSLLFVEAAAPATPGTGLVICYAKADGLLYCKDDAGTETAYAAAATDLAAHLADTADAHDASAISVADAGAVFTGTDVEAVLAELQAAIAGGGIPATILDAKGDLIAASAADTAARLAVGADGTVLMAASSETTGLKWNVPTEAAVLGCGLTHSVDIDLTHNSGEQSLPFNTEVWDNGGFHDTASNQERVTIPAGLGGKYLWTVFYRFSGNPGRTYSVVRKQTAGIIVGMGQTDAAAASEWAINHSGVTLLAAGDYLEFKCLLTNNVNIEATTADYGALVTVTRLGT